MKEEKTLRGQFVRGLKRKKLCPEQMLLHLAAYDGLIPKTPEQALHIALNSLPNHPDRGSPRCLTPTA